MDTAARSAEPGTSSGVLVVSLLTQGSPAEVTGGHLYHRRMAEAAGARGARLDVIPTSARHPFRDVDGVVLVDSLAAWSVAPTALARRRPRGPLAAIVHQPPGGIGQGRVRTAFQAPLDEALYRRCDVVIAASRALAGSLADVRGLPAERICVAEPGRDLPPAAGPAPDLRRGRAIAVLCVANWVPNKGVLELLEAVAALSCGQVTLHLAGRTDVDEAYGELVRARLNAPDLAARVVVHGLLDQPALAALYAGADVFALPSYVETYGTVYAEALSAGLPAVGWRSGNLPNLVDDGREGCLVPPGDVAALSDALARLTSDDAWRSALAAAARRRGATLNTWDDTADAFFGALRGLRPALDGTRTGRTT